MSSTIIFSISALCYSFVLLIVFFSKDNFRSLENKIYSYLIITIFIGLIVEISGVFLLLGDSKLLSFLQMKGYQIYLLCWISLFTLYTIVAFKDNVKEKRVKGLPLLITILVIGIISVLILPTEIYNQDGKIYTYGLSINFVYIYSFICIITIAISIIKNIKKTFQRKYLPMPLFVLLGIIVMAVQTINSGLLLISYAEALITFLMYFTIENPDTKVIEELYKNKKIIEKNNEDTSNFLFKISQDIKNPVKKIIEITNASNDERLKEVNNLSKNLEYIINDTLDVTKMSLQDMKIYNTRYNPYNIFVELKHKYENKNSKIKFNLLVTKNIPTLVYGDSIKLKQIISSVIENSYEHTKQGFVELEINTIIRYDICRFIIDITDNGEGISINKINNILSLEPSNMNSDFDKVTLKLLEAKSLINEIGGSFMIKSDEGNGTDVSIIIDQKIVETKETKNLNKLYEYEESLYNDKKVMIIDDDVKELAKITHYLEAKGISVSGSLFGTDIIDKIKNGHKYDLIFLADETSTYSALSVLKELKKIKGFSIPVIVMINENKEFIKKHYLKDGFEDVIKKTDLKNEIERVVKNY